MSGSATGPGDNRLATSSSPYLRLHRRNPVDWYPWGEEAIRRAQEEDRPLFVSIGYSTCFWCHVMERESFSDPGIAALMNESFVNVKIDREERPDLDDIYMAATQIFSGHGGWPNSVFLTPDLEPFFAGTYFPPESRHGQPGFPAVLKSLAEAWQTRREDVKVQAASLADAVRRSLDGRAEPLHGLGGAEAVERAVAALGRRFDPTWGGFSGAPKFPSPGNLILLHERAAEDPKADGMLSKTLDQMARGGIYDQLAGGFHRYSVDGEWRVPHFEKMLHDNGLLLEIYAREAARLGVETPDGAERARIARETAEFLLTGMRHPDEPAFRAAIDAETEGEEGAYYVWRREELLAVLGDEDFGFLAPLLGFDGAPNFEEGRYVLHRPEPTAEQASRRQRTAEQLEAEMAPLRRRLEAARAERKAPAIDEKILADWNGMAVAGLATAGRVLEEPSWIGAAAEAARFVLERLRRADGTLAHSWAAGQPGAGAFLADYAFLLRGLLALDEADSEGGWSERAVSLAEEAVERLSAPAGGFYGAAPAADLLARGRDVIGGAVPSGNGVMAIALADLGDRTGDERWTNLGAATVRSVGGLLGRAPDAAPVLALAAARLGLEATEDPDRSRSIEAVRATLDLGDPDEEGWRSFSLGFELEPGFRLEEQSEGQLIGIGSRGAETREVVGAEGEGLGLSGELRTLTPGATIEITYAVCDDDRCLLPVTRIIPIA